MKDRFVIVCTSHRGVFAGWATEDASALDKSVKLKQAKMAIYFGTTRGVMELAETGPTESSRISAQADIEVNSITAIFEVTEEARKKWEAA